MTTVDETPVAAPAVRLDLAAVAPDFYRAMRTLSATADRGVDPRLAELVKTRASMINGCAYCIDMHTADAVRLGEAHHRLLSLPAWRETPWFTARERAALALTEAVTLLTEGHVPDAVHREAAAHFDETELGHLIGLIVVINAWNRISVTCRFSPAAR